jgi:hypothetical protein
VGLAVGVYVAVGVAGGVSVARGVSVGVDVGVEVGVAVKVATRPLVGVGLGSAVPTISEPREQPRVLSTRPETTNMSEAVLRLIVRSSSSQ